MTDNVKMMMEKFMEYHNQGYTIAEVADIFGITRRTIYYKLELIAKNNKVSRDSLLQNPHKPHRKPVPSHFHKSYQKQKVEIEQVANYQVNSEVLEKSNYQSIQEVVELLEEYQKADSKLDVLLTTINEIMVLNRRK